jgi:hypothetical protein
MGREFLHTHHRRTNFQFNLTLTGTHPLIQTWAMMRANLWITLLIQGE